MLKFLRRSVLIGLLIVILLIGGIWFFADGLLKTAIEKGGTSAIGAKVEVGSAAMSWSPLGIHVNELKITNPDKPMENMVEMASIQSDVHFLPLLAGQVLIDKLGATGVKFNTARASSGAIQKAPETKSTQNESGLDLGGLQQKLPSADEILARETLKTPEKAQALKDSMATSEKEVKQQISQLPDENKLKNYEKRLKALTADDVSSIEDLQQRKQELEKLKKELSADKKKLQQTRETISKAKKDLETQYSALKSAPKEDMAHLKQRYSFDSQGASNMTRLLFGDEAQQWLDMFQTWYGRLQEVLPDENETPNEAISKNKGDNMFAFAYEPSLPKLLIKHAQLSAIIPLGDINIDIKNITHQPHILGQAMILKANGKNLSKVAEINADGVLNHVNPKATSDKLEWQIKQWKIDNFNVSKSSSLPVSIAESQAQAKGELSIINNQLNGLVDASFDAVKWDAQASKGWESQISNALKSIEQFKLQGDIKGKISSPELSISSDLDDQMQTLVSKALKSQQAEIEKKLKNYLDNEVEQAAGPYQKQVSLLKNTEGSIDQRLAQIEEMLKSEIKSVTDAKKKEVQKKAEEELKNKLKGFGF